MEHRSTTEEVREAAAAWVVRLHARACTDAERSEFEAWRDASFHSEAAYERELAAWERLDRLRALGAGDGPMDADLLAPVRAPRSRLPVRLAASVLLAIGLIGAGVVAVSAPPAYATGVGERRVVVLDDGSRIELNTDTKVVVRYHRGLREVELLRGEALFQVADDTRPFVVVADNTRLTTRRSEMTVRIEAEESVVQVSDGTVQLSQSSPESTVDPVILAPRTEAVFDGARAQLHPISAELLGRRQAWRQGGLWLDGQSLGEAVEEFNRYNKRKLVLSDPTISGLRLGGYFRTSDIEGFVSALTRAFPVAAETRDGNFYLEPRA